MMILDFFVDPVMRAPTLGSMLMCLAASLAGVLIFVQRKSLLGETLAHASYPGVTLAAVLASVFDLDEWTPFLILIGAFCTALVGFYCINYLKKQCSRTDSALTFVLAAFFGIGITIASYAQFFHTHEFRKIQTYLYGQAATMTDRHVILYAALALSLIALICCFYKELHIFSFDRQLAQSMGIKVDKLFLLIVVLAVVTGIRCVGVILMSGMLIAPATAARQYTHRLSSMFILSGLIGVLSGFIGNYLSVIAVVLSPDSRLSLPTGPMIVLVAGSLAFLSLLLAPEKGLLIRFARVLRFRSICIQENMLKMIWRGETSISQLYQRTGRTYWNLRLHLIKLQVYGYLSRNGDELQMTPKGQKRGAHIVRLHRLWELYLAKHLGMGIESVHGNAEEMEHILNHELEQELTELLHDPKHDPHKQPIPARDEVMTDHE